MAQYQVYNKVNNFCLVWKSIGRVAIPVIGENNIDLEFTCVKYYRFTFKPSRINQNNHLYIDSHNKLNIPKTTFENFLPFHINLNFTRLS